MMLFEDLEIIWRDKGAQPTHTIDDEALRRIVADRAHSYRRKILWRDIFEIGMDVFVVVMLIAVGLWAEWRSGGGHLRVISPMLVTAIGYAFVATFRFASRQRQKGREKLFDDSIRGNLERLVSNADYQIRLKSWFAWWYLVPLIPGYMLITRSTTEGAPVLARWIFGGLMCLLFWFMDWGNKRQLRTELVPQKEELEALLAGLENGGRSAEIRSGSSPSSSIVTWSRRFVGLTVALLIFGVVGWFLWANYRPAENPEAPKFDDISAFDENDKARIDAWLRETVERAQYPSLSVAIVRAGTTVYEQAFGFENTWREIRATTNTAYHVASVTKVFTASLAVMLHERGVVDLDLPLARYLPEDVVISTQPEAGETITLRQLASHTSGLPRGVPGSVQSVEGRYALEPQRLYHLLAGVKLEFLPGEGERYSNLGFGLLGHALERAAKKPLNQLLQELLCGPLQLERTAYHVDEDLPVATGYTTPVQLPETHSYRERLAGSGGLVTSAGDLAKFLAAQMQPGVFTSNMLSQFHIATRLKDGLPAGRSLGWRIDSAIPGGVILSKNGGRKNCSAWIGFSPDHDIGVAVVANIGGPEVDPIGYWLLGRAIPGGRAKPATANGAAKVAPYSGVRWENNRPVVEVQGRWSPLASIDAIPVERILEFAEKEYRSVARKRFAEDLPEVLLAMGHQPEWEVTLGLEIDGQVRRVKVEMTKENRDRVRR
ncbi:MAG: beta-lactamase family protein [Verrucomicrobiae bacterium]|nr:beta-lactamase family protein [Verrucomicrobiae bacterium]